MTEDKPTVVFPEKEVRLLNGKYVVVKPWNLALGRRMRKRITKMFADLQAERGNEVVDLVSLVDTFEDEIVEIVKETLGVEQEWLDEHFAYEDLFAVAQVVVEVCVFRGKDQGGFLGKLMGMTNEAGVNAQLPAALQTRLDEARREWSQETKTNETDGSPKDSPSSPDVGTGTLNTSDTPSRSPS